VRISYVCHHRFTKNSHLVGPIIEAFGFSRIIFASSSSSAAEHPSAPANWYELAREAVAELGIDQEGVDAIFGGNAQSVYSTN
jgi:predicted TIM-barrel fold metal-dependent hydrolase